MAVEEFDELSDFGDGDRPSVRRQTAPATAKSRAKRVPDRRAYKAIAYSLAVVIAIAAGCYFARGFLLQNERFQLVAVEVTGINYVSPEDVQEIFAPDLKKSVLRVPLDKRIAEVQALPWVRTASVRRVFPNHIRVAVVERVPVAFVSRDDGLSLIDNTGAVMDMPDGASFQFPVVRGIEENDTVAEREQKMRIYTSLMKDLDRGGLPRESISEVSLEDPEDARLVLSDAVGSTLLHLGNDNYFARYQTYLTNVNDWRGKFPHLHSVDLRYKGQVVVNADPSPASQLKPKIAEASLKQPPLPIIRKQAAPVTAAAKPAGAPIAHQAPAAKRKKVIASTGPISQKSSKKVQRP